MKRILALSACILVAFFANAQTTLTADQSILSNNGFGQQTWGDGVTISAIAIDGSPGQLVYDTEFRDEGFGVAGARWQQIDFYEDYNGLSNVSEKVSINFNGPVNQVVLTVGMMGANEGHPQGETGKWNGYDANGNLVASGVLGADDSNLGPEVKLVSNSYGIYPISLSSTQPMESVTIEATGFGYGQGQPQNRSYGENNSDFNVVSVTYTRVNDTNSAPVATDDSPSPIREDIGLTGFSYDVFLSNDIDADGDDLEIVSFDFSNFPGTIEDLRSDREILFRTALNFNGQIQIPYTITDGQRTSSATITLTIIDILDDLTIGQDGPFDTFANLPEIIPVSDLLSNDTVIPYLNSPTEIVLTEVGNAINGTVSLVDDNVVFTPSNNFVGQASFTYSVEAISDAPFGGPSPVDEGTSAPIIINVANQPGNTAPVAVDDSPSPIREDIGLTGFSYDVFLANDTDADGDELEIVSFDFSNFPGTIEDLRSDREILFRTAVNFSGTIEIPYTVADGQNTSSAIITLTITDIIDELTIGDDGPFSTDVDQSLEIAIADLLANDEANNFGSPITIELTAVGNSTNGVAAIVGDNVVFTPSPGFVGTASFTYDVDVLSGSVFGSDKRVDEGTSNPIIINVEGDIVTPPSVNGSFVLVSKADESLSLQVNSTGNRTSAVVEACDETGQVWTISDRGNGFHKFINDYADRALEAWSPTPGNGDDVTIYTSNNRDWQQWEITDAGDGYFQIGGRYNTRLMTLSNGNAIMLDADGSDNQLWKFLSPEDFACSVNNPPVAEFDGDFFSDPFYTLVEGETLVIPFDSLLANDFDPDGDPLTITEVFFVRNGTPVIVGNTVEFTGESASPGALFGYTVSDGRGGTDRGDVGLNILERPTIEAVDDTPGPVREDIGLTGFSYDVFLANDIGDNLEIESFDFSNFPGTIEDLRAEREILFRTAVNFNGTIEIPYTVTDGQNTSSAIITLTITDIIDELTIGDDGPFSTDADLPLEIAITDLLANDEANNFGSPITIELTAVGNSSNGVATIVGDNVVFTPSPGFVGTASFTYDVDVLSGSVFGSDKRVDEGTSNPIVITVEGDIVTPPSINGSFVLVSKANESLSLQVNATGNRTSAIVEACDEVGQVWTISDRGNGYHKIINDYADRALEAWQPSPGNGDDVTIYASNNRDWQQWEIIDAGNGYFQVRGRYNTRLMTLSNGNAIMLDADGSDNQLWQFVDAANFTCGGNTATRINLTASNLNLDGTSNIQSWSDCVSIRSLNYDGVSSIINVSSNRIAPSEGRYSTQLDYDPATGRTEKLIIDFAQPVTNISIMLGNLEVSEYQGMNETGYWIAYDPEMNQIGEGLIDPASGTLSASGVYSFDMSVNSEVSSLELGATAYNHGQGTGVLSNNSDYSLIGLSYSTSSTCSGTSSNARKSGKSAEQSELDSFIDQFSFSAYPNPTDGKLTLLVSDGVEGELTIYNNIGTIVRTLKLKSTEGQQEVLLDMTSYKSGFYFIKLNNSADQRVLRIFKN